MDLSDDVRRLLTEFVTAFDKHMAERNRLRAESIRQYDEYTAQERRRLDLTEESNRLCVRDIELRERESQLTAERLSEQRRQQRRAITTVGIMIGIPLVVLIVLLATGQIK
jgi:hypothetical protein